jgi:hypothetical protein
MQGVETCRLQNRAHPLFSTPCQAGVGQTVAATGAARRLAWYGAQLSRAPLDDRNPGGDARRRVSVSSRDFDREAGKSFGGRYERPVVALPKKRADPAARSGQVRV